LTLFGLTRPRPWRGPVPLPCSPCLFRGVLPAAVGVICPSRVRLARRPYRVGLPTGPPSAGRAVLSPVDSRTGRARSKSSGARAPRSSHSRARINQGLTDACPACVPGSTDRASAQVKGGAGTRRPPSKGGGHPRPIRVPEGSTPGCFWAVSAATRLPTHGVYLISQGPTTAQEGTQELTHRCITRDHPGSLLRPSSGSGPLPMPTSSTIHSFLHETVADDAEGCTPTRSVPTEASRTKTPRHE
jgi:hypothetical protein